MNYAETKRLAIVNQFEKLNLNGNKELNDLVLLAVEICDAPIVLITLMNEHTQLIKCKVGLNAERISKEDSFCKYLTAEGIMVIPDALADVRFANNPAVTGDLRIRFYVGAPLITADGFHIGSLCLADQQPHSFSALQKEMLAILARQVIHMMESIMTLELLKQRNSELEIQKQRTKASERKLRGFFNSSASCHILIDKNYKILDFNKASQSYVQQYRAKQIKSGNNIKSYIDEQYHLKFVRYFDLALTGSRTDKEVLMVVGNQQQWWNISFQPIFNSSSKVISIAFTGANVNERKNNIAEINSQNQQLLEVAYIQSHEYRRPVASIMGLMNIIKADDYVPDKECLLMMEAAVEELDQKLRKVINQVYERR